MLPYAHLLGNDTLVIYGKIQYLYARVILYEYFFIYQTVVNTFRVVMTNVCEHVTKVLTCHFILRDKYYYVV